MSKLGDYIKEQKEKDIQKFCAQHGIEKMAPPINKGIER